MFGSYWPETLLICPWPNTGALPYCGAPPNWGGTPPYGGGTPNAAFPYGLAPGYGTLPYGGIPAPNGLLALPCALLLLAVELLLADSSGPKRSLSEQRMNKKIKNRLQNESAQVCRRVCNLELYGHLEYLR